MKHALFILLAALLICIGRISSTRACCGSSGPTLSMANSATGTVINELVSVTGAPSTAISTTAGATGGVIGICVSGCGTSGIAVIQLNGSSSLTFDGATTAGDYVQISPTANGQAHDVGAIYPALGQVIGRVLSTNASGGTYSVDEFDEIQASTCPPSDACPEVFGAKGDGTTLVDTTPTPNVKTYGNSTSPSAQPIATTVANEQVVSVLGTEATGAITGPGTPTSRVNISGSSGVFGIYVGDQTISSISQTTAQTGTTASAAWTSATIGIPPLGGVGTVTFGAASSSSLAASNAITLNVPSGSTAGDELIGVIISFSTFTPAGTAVSSFTALHNTGAISGQANLYLYYRQMQVGDTSFTINSDSNTGHAYALLDYKNAGTPDNGISSVSAKFASTDVGKLACMDGVSATLDASLSADDICGTISTFVNSHLVTPSFNTSINNGYTPQTLNSLLSSGAEFDYATDDCNATNNPIQTAINSLVRSGTAGNVNASGGGTLLLSKRYGCSQALTFPNNLTVNIHGLGSGLTRWGFSSTTSTTVSNNYNSNTVTGFLFLTHSLTNGAVQFKAALNNAPFANMTHNVWDNFSLNGGAGMHWDGGGGAGIVLTNAVRTELRDLAIMNFSGPCILMNVPSGANGSLDYLDIVELKENYITGCQYGVEIDNAAGSAATLESLVFDTNQIENNLLSGVWETSGSTIWGLVFQGSNVLQRDDISGTANIYEIQLNGTVNGCNLSGTYFEKDSWSSIAGFVKDSGQCNRQGEASANALGVQGIVIGKYAQSLETTAPSGVASDDLLWADSTAHGWKLLNNNGTAEQVVGNSAGVNEFTICAGPQVFGNTSAPNNYASGGSIASAVATNACHFVQLASTNVFHAATCTTAPTFNVYDGGTNVGTAKIASATLQARGTATTQAETQTIAAGDTYGIEVSTAGGTCLTDEFQVCAEISCP